MACIPVGLCVSAANTPYHRSQAAFKSGPSLLPVRRRSSRTTLTIQATAETNSNLTKAVVAAGLVANPVVLVSEYFLKTTGEGLPPGPGGLYGATEGISYLVIVSVVGWSLYTKLKTGSGLPGSLLGAVEGLSYLSLVAGIVVAALVFAEKGSLPGITG